MPFHLNPITVLEDTTASAEESDENLLAKKIIVSTGEELALFVEFATITVEQWHRSGIGVEVSGPRDWMSTVDMHQGIVGALFVVANGNLPVPPGGNPALRGKLPPPPYGEGVSRGVSVRIYAAAGTGLFMELRSATARVTGHMGPLKAHLRNASVDAERVSDSLAVHIRKKGSVHVQRGSVRTLCVATAGDTDVSFGGRSREAWLTATGNSSVRVGPIAKPYYAWASKRSSIEVRRKK